MRSFQRVHLLLLLDRPDEALAAAREHLAAATRPEEEALRRCDVIDALLLRDEPRPGDVAEARAHADQAHAVLPWAAPVAICRAMALAETAPVDDALEAADAAAARLLTRGERVPHPVLDAYRAIALRRAGRDEEARARVAGWDPAGMPPPLVRRVARIATG